MCRWWIGGSSRSSNTGSILCSRITVITHLLASKQAGYMTSFSLQSLRFKFLVDLVTGPDLTL